MKKLILIIASFLGLVACENKSHNSPVVEIRNYVDSVENANNNDYTEVHWVEINEGYNARLQRIEGESSEYSDEQKKQLDEAKQKYEQLKEKYQAQINSNSRRGKIGSVLFGAGKIGTDLSFKWVNASNILGVYDGLVKAVKANENNFSREDWDEVKLIYEGLDARKNEVEKEGLSADDNMKIAKLKIEFAAMNTFDKAAAKTEEKK